MKKSLVSIVLCTYNGEKYLKEQFDSILNQTYPEIEIIVCDDGSTDNTVPIIRQYQVSNPNIKLFINEQNLGINKNMEQGFIKSQGKYIAPCDQDDIWDNSKIEKLVNKIEEKNLHLVYCDGYITDSALKIQGKESDVFKFYRGKNAINLLVNNCVSGHGMLFNKQLLDTSLPLPSNKLYYDYWLTLHALCFEGIDFVNEPLIKFRRHESAATLFKKTSKIYSTQFQNSIYEQILFCKHLRPIEIKILNELIISNKERLAGKYSFKFAKLYILHGNYLRRKNFISNLVFAIKNAKPIK